MADILPPGIADRQKKGFGIPVAEWFKRELRDPLEDELSPERLERQGIFVPCEVRRLVTEHMAGKRDHRKPLWTLFVFQLWHRRWVEAPALAGRAGASTQRRCQSWNTNSVHSGLRWSRRPARCSETSRCTSRGSKIPCARSALGRELVLQRLAQLALEPFGDRDPEALLRPVGDARRQDVAPSRA